MIWLRYLFFFIVSLFIHSLAFSFDAQPALSYSVAKSQERALSIQLVAQKPPVEVAKVQEKPVVKQPKKVEKPKVVNKKSIVRERVKVEKKAPKKAVLVAKKALPKEKIVPVKKPRPAKAQQVEVVEAQPEKVVPKVQAKPESTVEAPTEQEHLAENPAKAAQPKMIEKVTFSARPAPISYPHSAKRRNIEGTVLVEVWIDELGKQIKQLIINSSGHEALDNAALAGIAQWQFSRQQANGQAIAHRVQVPINFELN